MELFFIIAGVASIVGLFFAKKNLNKRIKTTKNISIKQTAKGDGNKQSIKIEGDNNV